MGVFWLTATPVDESKTPDEVYEAFACWWRYALRHPKPYTLHPKLETLNPKLNPEPQTLHPQPKTLTAKPYTLNPTPCTLNTKLYNPKS